MNKSKVLEFFSGEVRKPVSFAELCTLLGVKKAGRNQLQSVVRELTRAGDLVRIKGGRLGLPRKMNLVVGELRCSPKGFGFVVPTGGGDDVFIAARDLGNEITGDTVVARITRRGPKGETPPRESVFSAARGEVAEWLKARPC